MTTIHAAGGAVERVEIRTRTKAPFMIVRIKTEAATGRLLDATREGYGHGGDAMITRVRKLNRTRIGTGGDTGYRIKYAAFAVVGGLVTVRATDDRVTRPNYAAAPRTRAAAEAAGAKTGPGFAVIGELEGAELDRLADALAEARRAGWLVTFRVALDGGLKYKINEGGWTPALGKLV
jgi:hypothetical protein